MAVTVKHISFWRKEAENQPGVLAATLEPFARTGANLHVLMCYRYPGNEARGAVEVYPVAGKKLAALAGGAGLAASAIPCLLVEADNKPGLGHAIAQAISGAGINLSFLMAQAIGRRCSAVLGFESDTDAKRAAPLVKKAAAGKGGSKRK